ncbi:MAG: xanthine dehydrogenase family protein subunit M [Proteobacteria bacterium]|nr:xanthine dehydrogenase family protein subunit M [Pseudomonadota bacterium]
MYGEFKLEMPQQLDEALALIAEDPAEVLSGGTNLMIELRARKLRPEQVVSLDALSELRGIEVDGNRITLGARTTISDILRCDDMAEFGPSLLDAANLFAGQMVRNMGTVGGNIACSSPAADLVPPLMSLDAEITLVSSKGTRKVALCDYYLSYKKDVRAPSEMITSVSWKKLAKNSSNSFYKLARRIGDAITVTGVAVTLTMDGDRCTTARIALGAVAPTVFRATNAEKILEGQILTDDLITTAAQQAKAQSSPISDVRASAEYRLHTVGKLTHRLLTQARDKLV